MYHFSDPDVASIGVCYLDRVSAAVIKYSHADENLFGLLYDLNIFLKKEKAFRNKMMKVYRLAKEEVKYGEKAKNKLCQAEVLSNKAKKAGQQLIDLLK